MTKITTRQSTIRDHGSAVMALASARKEDGTAFTYADILTAVGLPSNRDWQRSLSKYIVDNGKRRRCEYTHKREPVPASETLPGVLDEPQPETFVDTDMLRDIHRKIYDCMTALSDAYDALGKAVQDLHTEWWRMIGAVGIKPGDANE